MNVPWGILAHAVKGKEASNTVVLAFPQNALFDVLEEMPFECPNCGITHKYICSHCLSTMWNNDVI